MQQTRLNTSIAFTSPQIPVCPIAGATRADPHSFNGDRDAGGANEARLWVTALIWGLKNTDVYKSAG